MLITLFDALNNYLQQSKETKAKPSPSLDHESDVSENAESNTSENTTQKVHVEFREEPEEVPVKVAVQVPVKVGTQNKKFQCLAKITTAHLCFNIIR